jgi:hypothetical protein
MVNRRSWAKASDANTNKLMTAATNKRFIR